MKNIFNNFGLALDLGNIKSVELKNASTYNGYPSDWYVHIELLNGHEYIQNPDTGEKELIKPIIKIECTSGDSAGFVYKEIIKYWEKFLQSKQKDQLKASEK